MKRPWTPDRRNESGSTTVTMKRCCNGCGRELGDASLLEVLAAIGGKPLPDVRGECPDCCPVHAKPQALDAGICRCGSDGDNPCVCPVYARSISGPMSGLVTPPRCRNGHDLAVCECPWLNRDKKTGADW